MIQGSAKLSVMSKATDLRLYRVFHEELIIRLMDKFSAIKPTQSF